MKKFSHKKKKERKHKIIEVKKKTLKCIDKQKRKIILNIKKKFILLYSLLVLKTVFFTNRAAIKKDSQPKIKLMEKGNNIL